MRRKRFQRGCLRKVKSRDRWKWIGKYYEKGGSRTKVLGYCAWMSEGGARARLQELLQPINEGAGFGQVHPRNFRDYVLKSFIPRKREGGRSRRN